MREEVLDQVADGLHLIGGFLGNLDLELFFDRHEKFAPVEVVVFRVFPGRGLLKL